MIKPELYRIWLSDREPTKWEMKCDKRAKKFYEVKWIVDEEMYQIPSIYSDTVERKSDWIRFCLLSESNKLYADRDVYFRKALKLDERWACDGNRKGHISILWSGEHPEIANEVLKMRGDRHIHCLMRRVLRGCPDDWHIINKSFYHHAKGGIYGRHVQN